MNDSFINEICLRWSITLLHFLWQGAAIGVVVFFADKLLRNRSASARYLFHAGAFLGLPICIAITFAKVTLPSHIEDSSSISHVAKADIATPDTMPRHLPESHTPVIEPLKQSVSQTNVVPIPIQPTEKTAIKTVEQPFLSRVAPLIMIAYLLGACFFVLRLSVALWGGHRLRIASTKVTNSKILEMIKNQSRKVGLRFVPLVAYCERIAVPTVIGVLKPMILLPASLVTGLDSEQFGAILSHELAHIRRNDLLMNLLQRLIESVLFFHPVVWYISRQMSAERESCCDDLVVTSGYRPIDYAGALIRMAEFCIAEKQPETTALAASGDNPSQLEQRIQRLLNSKKQTPLRLTRNGVILMTLLFISLAITPVALRNWAQADDPSKSVPQPVIKTDKPDEISWGKPVSGLQVGALLVGDSNSFKNGSEPEFQLFVRNTTNKSVTIKLQIPHPADGWQLNVTDNKGNHVHLKQDVLDYWVPLHSLTLKLKPGKTVPITGVKQEIKKIGLSDVKNTSFKIARKWNDKRVVTEHPNLISTGGNYKATYTITLKRPDIPGLQLNLNTAPVSFVVLDEEKKEKAARPPIKINGFDIAPFLSSKNSNEHLKSNPVFDRDKTIEQGGSWFCWAGSGDKIYRWKVNYSPLKQLFYVHENRGSKNSKVYGPIKGDAIEKLRLLDGTAELMAKAINVRRHPTTYYPNSFFFGSMSPTNASMRKALIFSLLRSLDSSLQTHGLKAVIKLGDLTIEEFPVLAFYVEEIAKSKAGKGELKKLVAAAKKYLTIQSVRFEGLRIELDKSEYLLGRKPTKAELAANWGKANDGLSMAVAGWTKDVRNVKAKDQLNVNLLIRNVSDSPKRITTPVHWGMRVLVTDEKTNHSVPIDIRAFWKDGWQKRYLLQPGEIVVIKKLFTSIEKGDKIPKGKTRPSKSWVQLGKIKLQPNRNYRIDVKITTPSFYQTNKAGKIILPAKGEFKGKLIAKPVHFALQDEDEKKAN